MDKLESLIKMLQHRVNSLRREATKLSRMASASRDDRERRNLREISRQTARKADMMEARLKRLIDLSPVQGDQANG